ncbi:asparagine synthase (glutamine-hydrolyzing) [Terrimonas sp. NA20]|uniref:asparagine synthase (glutamine-hydrolyzing) n=1 Tax=Terrimonas ginsenosidimutans TaxID=2908004 RepID=A0ABS9L033_9BACT|nr:asparagine synthase (glutamine-hydrolyzing) [Terrimonas ginsenosidimutans]MCG2617928.1 asparagine synthase (glutamine-hydrolyzing) [Terrimonas ginsenosidimutans]
MCGIAGTIQNAPLYNKQHVQQMMHVLAHRGPDGEGYWQNADNSCLLGHLRLAIIDTSDAAAQPLHYTPPTGFDQRYSIVYNGEIYNYQELKDELRKLGYSFQTASDTEVILAAYDCWDEDCLLRFDGMFAFAIWDEKEKELFAARDRFGEKPFYYCRDQNALLFASEMKALWAAGIRKVPNLKMLFNFITIGYVDNPERPEETFFDNISQLPPASSLFFYPSTGELVIEPYWELSTDIHRPENEKEAIERFGEMLEGSVKRRLRSDMPVGTSLSGGLDSSSISSMVNTISSQTFSQHCFTAGFPDFGKDEIAFARLVADKFGLQQHITNVTVNDLLDKWKIFCHHQEEPVSSASAFAQFKVFELAKQHNISVLLDGQGADETLAGYHKYYKWYWQELFHQRKLIRGKEIDAARRLGVQEPFGLKNVLASLLPDLASVILEKQYLFHALAQEDLDRDFVRLQSKEAYYSTPELSSLNGILHFNTCIHGLNELLRYADRNSMAHGREVRLPFLDHQLVEFVFSLPPEYKIRQGWTKWILRQKMDPQLPGEITWRKDKTGFEPPQKQWLQNKVMQEMVHAARSALVAENVLDKRVLSKPLQPADAYDKNNYDWRYLSAASTLFTSA